MVYMQYLVILGAIFSLLSGGLYLVETLRGKIQPNKVTWLLWAVAPLIGSVAAYQSGVRWAALPVFMAGFMPLLIFMASFVNREAYWQLTRFDAWCGLASILALVLWFLTRDPFIAILFSVLADAMAAIPTFYKGWKFPDTESLLSYVGGALSAITSFFAIKTWNFESLAFPVYLVLMEVGMIYMIARGRKKEKKWLDQDINPQNRGTKS